MELSKEECEKQSELGAIFQLIKERLANQPLGKVNFDTTFKQHQEFYLNYARILPLQCVITRISGGVCHDKLSNSGEVADNLIEVDFLNKPLEEK